MFFYSLPRVRANKLLQHSWVCVQPPWLWADLQCHIGMVFAIALVDSHHLEWITECQQIQELKRRRWKNWEPDRNIWNLHPQNKCVHTNMSYLAQAECVKVKAYQQSNSDISNWKIQFQILSKIILYPWNMSSSLKLVWACKAKQWLSSCWITLASQQHSRKRLDTGKSAGQLYPLNTLWSHEIQLHAWPCLTLHTI